MDSLREKVSSPFHSFLGPSSLFRTIHGTHTVTKWVGASGAFVFVTLLSACGAEAHTYLGHRVVFEDELVEERVSIKDVNDAVEIFARTAAEILGSRQRRIEDLMKRRDEWAIHFTSVRLGPDTEAGDVGQAGGGVVLVSVLTPCLHHSALSHELSHLLEDVRDGVWNNSHENDLYWGPVGIAEESSLHAVMKFCPEE